MKNLITFEVWLSACGGFSSTMAIRNAGKVLNMNIVRINKVCSKLKNNNFQNPALRIAKPLPTSEKPNNDAKRKRKPIKTIR